MYPLGALKGHQFHWLPWHGWQHLRSPCQNAASSAAGLTAEPRHLASRNRPGWHASGRPFPYPYESYEGPKKEKYAPHLCIGLYQLKPALGSAGQQKKIFKGWKKTAFAERRAEKGLSEGEWHRKVGWGSLHSADRLAVSLKPILGYSGNGKPLDSFCRKDFSTQNSQHIP